MGKRSKSRVQVERPTLEAVPNSDEQGDSKFARALGSSDYHTREKGVTALRLWLQRQLVQESSLDSLLKIWKGVFFCFWHSDKAPVQEDLAKRLAGVLPHLNDEVGIRYFSAFLITLHREWVRIDRLRLDKFMMMVRLFFREAFMHLASRAWERELIKDYMVSVGRHAFAEDDSTTLVGFSLHVTDLYLTELKAAAAACESVVPPSACRLLLEPFISLAARTHSKTLLDRVRRSVFQALIEDLQSEEDEAMPLKRVPVSKLAAGLQNAGEAADVRARNREVLYEASHNLERLCGKRARASSSPHSNGAEPQPKKAKKSKSTPSPTSKAASQDVSDPVENGARVLKEQCAANGNSQEPSGKKQKKKRRKNGAASPDGAAELMPDLAAAAREFTNGKRQRSSLDAAEEPISPPMLSAGAASSPVSEGRLTKSAAAALRYAVGKVSDGAARRKKSISFNLKKNVVLQIGDPMPAAELRTPPRAKPSGSALKKVSSLPVPRSAPLKKRSSGKGRAGRKRSI